MNKEIEIPEGYEARIEGNKVVLEPKESEDEKTRKEMINYISQIKALSEHGCRSGWDIRKEDAPKCERFIAYLEEHKESAWTEEDESFVTHILPRILNPDGWTLDQVSADKKYLTEFIERQKRKFTKEQKPANNIKPKFKVGDRVNKNDREDDEYCILTITSVNIDEHCYVCNQCSVIDFEEQDLWHIVEQKPAEWSEEDMLNLDNIIWLCENCEKGIETTWIPSQATKIKHLMKSIKEGSVQKQEWGEEDEEMLRIISNRLDKFSEWATEHGFPIDDPTMKQSPIAWLKSRRPQPKQLWSEEDEKFINDLCNLLASLAKNNRIGCYYAPDIINKIKNLRARAITYTLDAPLGYDNDMNPIYPPINHWKPSEEQMGALEHFIRSWGESGTMSPQNPILCAAESLYNELKKL